MEQIQILEAKVKALEELIGIKDEIISTLKSKPTQIQYVSSYQYYPYWYNQYPYYGAHQGGYLISQGGAMSGNIQSSSMQAQQTANANQQYCSSAMNQGSNYTDINANVPVTDTLTLAKFR